MAIMAMVSKTETATLMVAATMPTTITTTSNGNASHQDHSNCDDVIDDVKNDNGDSGNEDDGGDNDDHRSTFNDNEKTLALIDKNSSFLWFSHSFTHTHTHFHLHTHTPTHALTHTLTHSHLHLHSSPILHFLKFSLPFITSTHSFLSAHFYDPILHFNCTLATLLFSFRHQNTFFDSALA